MLALPPIAPEAIFHIGSFNITNTYINSLLTVVGFIIFAFFLQKSFSKHTIIPKGLVNFAEAIYEFVLGYIDSVTRDRKKSMTFLPFIATLFLFILVSNWIGLLPGIGSIGKHIFVEGKLELVPIFRPANTDLNLTLAMAVSAVVLSHFLGIFTVGFFKYANKFIKLGDLWHAIKSKNPQTILTAGVELIVGIIEIFSEIAKVLSLSLRLFGNVFAGEVLLSVLASILPFILPLPFLFLELLVGVIQATVFSMLTLVYLTIATTEIGSHGGHEKEHKESIFEPEPISKI